MEYIDIYTSERKLTGVQKIKGSPLNDDEFILIAHLVIFNSRGEMLIQKRKEDKKDWPGCWDITSGGGVRAGESSFEGALREVSEELGISVSLEDTRPLFTICYPIGFDDYYIITKDISLDEITIQPEEVTDVRWASYDEISEMAKNKSFVQYRKGFIDMLFSMKNGRGSYDV
jgi:isopentenyldiphosphate isomerase